MNSKFKWVTYGLFLVASVIFIACQQKSDEHKDIDHAVEPDVSLAQQEWETYNAKILDKIAENELKIQEIEEKMKGKNGTLDKMRQNRIDDLKKRNQDLRNKLTSWNNDYSKWDEFKMGIDQNIQELDKMFNDTLPK